VSIEKMKVAPTPVGTERLILRASLRPPPPRGEERWWLREVAKGVRPLRVLGLSRVEQEISRSKSRPLARSWNRVPAGSGMPCPPPSQHGQSAIQLTSKNGTPRSGPMRTGKHALLKRTKPSSTVSWRSSDPIAESRVCLQVRSVIGCAHVLWRYGHTLFPWAYRDYVQAHHELDGERYSASTVLDVSEECHLPIVCSLASGHLGTHRADIVPPWGRTELRRSAW
jgi:hypothetical protein